MNKKLLKIIKKDLDRTKKMVCSLVGATDLHLTLRYGSYDNIDLYMTELAKTYNVWRYQIELFKGVYVTINFL